VQHTVEHWLARSVEPVDASSLDVDAEVHWSDGAWNLDLSLESPSGRARSQLTAAGCATLVDVLALKVALAASALAVRPAARTEVEQHAPAPAWLLRAAAGARIGELSDVNAEFQVLGALTQRWWRFEVGASYVPPQTVRLAAPFADVGARVGAWTGLTRGCLVSTWAGLEFPLCLGVELGVLRAAGFGTPERRTWSLFFGAITLGPAWRWRFTRMLALWSELDLSLAFARPNFTVFDRGTSGSLSLYRPGSVAGAAILGLEFSF
jgi:hypothetical protein